MDGVQVQTGTETDENGTQKTVINVAPTNDEREEDDQTQNRNLADIPLGLDSTGAPVVQVSIPVGIGFNAEELKLAVRNDDDSDGGNNGQPPEPGAALRELLISATGPRTESEDDLNEIIQNGIDAYVPTVNNEEEVTVRTVTLNSANGQDGAASQDAIIVTGARGTGENDPDNPDRQEAIIIDTRELPKGSKLQLDQVEFAVIIGDSQVSGGEGRNIVTGDSGSQYIVLGAEDDILNGGAGNDIIGSQGGDDQLYGGKGDDILFGGTGNDILHGGEGTDIVSYSHNYAEYTLTQQTDPQTHEVQWLVQHAIDGTDTLIQVEYIEFADHTINLTGENEINDLAINGLLLF